MINYKQLDEATTEQDGNRILIERRWPNGFDQAVDKASLKIDVWNQNAAPSIELYEWYQQQDFQSISSEKRECEFWRCYRLELIAHPEHWMSLLDVARSGNLTLLYIPQSAFPNHAQMLADFLEDELDRFNDASSPVCYAHLNKLD